MKNTLILSLSAVILAACSQPPAPVAHKGGQFYGKVAPKQFASMQKHDYIAPKPAEAAPVAVMQVAEVTAPEPQVAVREVFAEISAPQSVVQAEAPSLEPLPLESIAQMHSAPRLAELNDRASNFIWPIEGRIISRFGPKQNGLINDGINIAAQEGEPIWAAASGSVAYAGNELKGYGNMMIISHSNGWMSAYAHASDMLVGKGDRVSQGDLIGYVGKTGAVNTAQLHFGIREGKKPVNPENLLPRRMASAQ
jgi:murein DD-endopeptidase MepM/ murein hydrolase activator NlpD